MSQRAMKVRSRRVVATPQANDKPPCRRKRAVEHVEKTPAATAGEIARIALKPSVQAALTIGYFSHGTVGELSPLELMQQLEHQCQQAADGNLRRAEAMLAAQAHTLDAIFNNLAKRAAMNLGEHLEAGRLFLILALRAQNQSRATLETLTTIKNPSAPTFVKQANIANGPQQVNNGRPSSLEVPHGKSAIGPNELLGVTNEQGQRLDTFTPQGAVGAHSSVAAVEARHRPKKRRR